ncbi:MAG: hypothetical protein ACTSVZ_05375 [Promethearchaeota archaeon]
MKNLPFIQIKVISNNSQEKTNRDLLEQVASKFRMTHVVDITWRDADDDKNVTLNLNYKSEENFEAGYTYGGDNFVEFVQALQQIDFPFHLLFPLDEEPDKETEDSPQEGPSLSTCYCVLEYSTNRKNIMRRNYQINWGTGEVLRTRFYVEEIASVFIMFFDRYLDFEIAQIDRLDKNAIKKILNQSRLDLTPELEVQIFSMFEKFTNSPPNN